MTSKSLERSHFAKIAENGFGDSLNTYAHSMAWFKDHLYVGTMRASFCLLKARIPIPMQPWPVKCPDNIHELDLRAQIWRYSPTQQQWEQTYIAPRVVGRTGETVARELSYRGMAVYDEPNSHEQALYVSTWSPAKGLGPLILRSSDGNEFVPVSDYGLGDETTSAFRSLTSFKGRLYTAPTGRSGGKPNTPDKPIILESADPERGIWHPICKEGFGDPHNLTIFELVSFNDYLYAGTLNPVTGYQIWKTRAEGTPPYDWTRVITHGAYRGPLNETVVSMQPFGDSLYIGSGIQNGGYDRLHRLGPAPPELIRIYPDDTWDLLVGEPRDTPNGYKRPLSNFGAGFGSYFQGYFWRMAAYDGSLYLGTFKWSTLLPYLQSEQTKPIGKKLVDHVGVDAIVNMEGGFDLFSSRDGVRWLPITTNGFGNPYNLGARTMAATPRGLFIGTANPFASHVGVRMPPDWEYVANPRGGAEVWLGSINSRLKNSGAY